MLSAKQHPRLATEGVEDQSFSNIDPTKPVRLASSIEPAATIKTWAAALVVSVPTIERMIRAGQIPAADFRVGRLPRWRPSTVRDWIESGGAR
jgi:excisionase family DNA binding protein